MNAVDKDLLGSIEDRFARLASDKELGAALKFYRTSVPLFDRRAGADGVSYVISGEHGVVGFFDAFLGRTRNHADFLGERLYEELEDQGEVSEEVIEATFAGFYGKVEDLKQKHQQDLQSGYRPEHLRQKLEALSNE